MHHLLFDWNKCCTGVKYEHCRLLREAANVQWKTRKKFHVDVFIISNSNLTTVMYFININRYLETIYSASVAEFEHSLHWTVLPFCSTFPFLLLSSFIFWPWPSVKWILLQVFFSLFSSFHVMYNKYFQYFQANENIFFSCRMSPIELANRTGQVQLPQLRGKCLSGGALLWSLSCTLLLQLWRRTNCQKMLYIRGVLFWVEVQFKIW